MSAVQSIHSLFSFKTFVVGLLGVFAVYAALFAYLFFARAQTLQGLEERLASQTVLVDRARVSEIAAHHDMGEAQTAHDSAKAVSVAETPHGQSHDEDLSLEELVGRQAKSLRQSPVPGFFEETEYGLLPVAKSPMQTPFEIYKKPFTLNLSKPYIAVGVKNFGLSKALSESMIAALPSSVSFILSPYSADPEEWVQKARADGHEVWLQLPIENNRFPLDDPGAKGLLTRVSLQYNQERLAWLLGRATGYAGIAAFTDSALNNSGAMFKNMARDIFGRGLGYFELNTASDSFFGALAADMGKPHTQAFALLGIIDPQGPALKAVQAHIDTEGGAVVTLNPSPNNIVSLESWLAELEQQGVVSVPVSAIADPYIERN
ncbi:MAG: divergent polysaccharide deacetylase family protein [Alphaproteobacteria bacterium]